MPLLGPGDPLPDRPRRVLVAGSSGAGKTTVAGAVAGALGLTHVELDALFHGPDWTPRPTFAADVERFVAGDSWVTEWQYDAVRDLLASRADLVVWLDLPRPRVMVQLARRTLVRRVRGELLWNGNVEPPLRTLLTDPGHVLRWGWTQHPVARRRVQALQTRRPELSVVRLRSRREVRRWTAGALLARRG